MKHFKMVLYGEPGVGKSTFAAKAPTPFFITTDGNYEFLVDYGAKESAHKQVNSWMEAKETFKSDFKGYETIVVDLTEDLFKWCEYEYCARNKFEHVGDVGFGKGYDITRNEFFVELCKLFAKEDKNVILIMHGVTTTVKDRRGVEHTRYVPSTRIPDKVIDMIEGRVRYFIRCYMKGEEKEDGTILKRRYLSLIPKENEFGIARGLDETKVPQDIPLDFECFANAIGLERAAEQNNSDAETVSPKQDNDELTRTEVKRRRRVKQENVSEEANEENVKQLTANSVDAVEKEEVSDNSESVVESDDKEANVDKETTQIVVENDTTNNETKELTNEEKLAAIRAKLAALKNR